MTEPTNQPVFRLDDEVFAALAYHNAKWAERWRTFLMRVPPPRWEPGIPVSADWRALYESYLPIAEYLASLRHVARLILPHPSWVPAALRLSTAHLTTRAAWFASLPDLWSYLPAHLSGTVLLTPEQLPTLLAALADPPQFGTADGRYPEQLGVLEHWARSRADREVRMLDLGSGTGEGTREAAKTLQQEGLAVRSIGITREPLEAWMATTHCFPHRSQVAGMGEAFVAAQRSGRGRLGSQDVCEQHRATADPTCLFVAGDATAVPCRGRFQVILCNGLVGGRFLHTDTAYRRVLAEFSRLSVTGGVILLGCRFHDGREEHLARFRELALGSGWDVAGDLRNLVLTRPGHRRDLPDGGNGTQ